MRSRSLAAVTVAFFVALCAAPADGRPPHPKPKPQCDRSAFRVLLDVGHTEEEPGALSARGTTEFEFNLRLARRIERTLSESGFSQTTLLVSQGSAIGALISRMHRANRLPADLFVSIHHDSVPEYLLDAWAGASGPARFSDRFRGYSLFVSFENVRREDSLAFARTFGASLHVHGLRHTPHYTEPVMTNRRRELLDADTGVYRFDRLYVLRTASMPAVLFEAGLIINRDEELLLATPEHQNAIATAFASALDTYCAAMAVRRGVRRVHAPGRRNPSSATAE